ncbi:NADH-quinone oxidoreductase subunit NuoF [bacterium]|nr:NADH-quinone oxidoreductase subunit NuoF [bacterium]
MKKLLVAPHGVPETAYRPSPETEKRIMAHVAKYPTKMAATIPVLHEIQNEVGYISREGAAYAAAVTETSVTHIYSVATFYSMFHLEPIGKFHVQVCTNTSCALNGAKDLVRHCGRKFGISAGDTSTDRNITLTEVECLASCGSGPCVQINRDYYEFMTPEKLDGVLDSLLAGRRPEGPRPTAHIELTPDRVVYKDIENDIVSLDRYRQTGGYAGLKKALGMKPEDIANEVDASGIRGLGGAGFPTGKKWKFLPKNYTGPIYLCINADEGEPGTFKDREILRRLPHRLIEGVVIAGYAIRATEAYVYIRGEFYEPYEVLQKAVDEARAAGLVGKNILGSGFSMDLKLHTGAGAYICGEETALLESLEGKRGEPRIKPPFPAVKGLFGCPTIINNVETIAQVPAIVERGAAWYRKRGTEKSPGTRVFCVSGHVVKPGLYELPNGTPMRDLIFDWCGGLRPGRTLKAVIPGGSSMPVLTADMAMRATMCNESLMEVGKSYTGSGGVIVMDDSTCMVGFLARLIKFYEHESCGQCTPCREGSAWARKILYRIEAGGGRADDIETLRSIARGIDGNTICALGEATAWPMASFLRNFEAEFAAHIEQQACPFKNAPSPSSSSFPQPSSSFPRKRESSLPRDDLDARLRGHDDLNSCRK